VPATFADKTGSIAAARMKKAQELAAEIPGAWYPCQHRNPHNPDAHTLFTAPEIEAAFRRVPDVVVVGISTAGQLAGIVRYFRERSYPTLFVGVDALGSVILGGPGHPYKMTGLGLSFVPPNFQRRDLHAAYTPSDALAFSVCHALAKREGLLLGASTGAIVAAGLAFASRLDAGKRILMINPDRGDRYLETVYNSEWLAKNGLALIEDSNELEAALTRLEPLFVQSEPTLLKVADAR
jgi:cysteine synthase A